MTGYAVEFHIPTEHFMSSLTKVSSTTRARHRAWIRRYARRVWRAAIEAGAYRTERFVALAMVQWPGPSIYPAMSCAETLKPVIDAGTDERLWPDDDNSHCRATVFMEAPGLSAYGVTMWVYIIPVGRIPDMPAWFVSMMPGTKGTLASIELDSETEWLNSNQRNEGPELDEKLARIMAKGYDSWKDKPAVLGDDVMLVAACLCPHPDLPMDSSNSAEDTLAFAACGATLGKLPQKPTVAVSTLSPKLSRPKHHGLEVMALHMPTGIYLPTLLTA